MVVCSLGLMLLASAGTTPALPFKLRLLLVRHGTSARDSLTRRGVAEARVVANVLKHQEIVAVIASPARRAQQTASIIAQELRPPVVVEEEAAFRVNQLESVEHAKFRALAAIQLLTRRYTGKTVVIVTHFDICAALLRLAAGDPKAAPCPRAPSISEIAALPDGVLELVKLPPP